MDSWICCQLGAREHYAVPRALQLNGLLGQLVTDVWAQRAGRFHPALATSHVTAANVSAFAFELKASLARENGWNLISRRNQWFQHHAVKKLAGNGSHTVFAYSYAAREIFKFARERGWRTVLGQIDPGPVHERIVAGINKTSTIADKHWKPAPKEYWDNWRAECALADTIVVNSEWA